MRLQGDSGLYLSGEQVKIPTCGIFITQPKIRDIVQFGEMDFFTASKMFGNPEDFFSSAKKGNSELNEFNNFQILLEVIKNGDEQLKSCFQKFFELCFPTYELSYTQNSINFKLKEEDNSPIVGMIQMYNFENFSIVVRELFDPPESQENKFNPSNELAKKIAEKLEKARKKKQKKSDSPQSIFSFYSSILSIGLQMDINIFYDYTPFQLYDAFTRYTSKQQYDLYQKIALQPFASTDSLDEPDNWQRNLYN